MNDFSTRSIDRGTGICVTRAVSHFNFLAEIRVAQIKQRGNERADEREFGVSLLIVGRSVVPRVDVRLSILETRLDERGGRSVARGRRICKSSDSKENERKRES